MKEVTIKLPDPLFHFIRYYLGEDKHRDKEYKGEGMAFILLREWITEGGGHGKEQIRYILIHKPGAK